MNNSCPFDILKDIYKKYPDFRKRIGYHPNWKLNDFV